jgi:uncharacterized protein YbgA (DUF1722 family)/uncharacterized protein YbbK (DUF523 family)
MGVARANHTDDRVALGVSSCLLGKAVRHDGRDKRNQMILNVLSQRFELVSCCPEVEIGLGIPRRPLRLVATADGTRACGIDAPGHDVTDALTVYAGRIAQEFHHISGFIFKRGSPSCGVHDVPVVTESGEPAGSGSGVFAAALIDRLPGLPVEEEARLEDAALRENFIERVQVFHRWQRLIANGLSHAGLIEFHTRHKFSLLAHDEAVYRRLGPLVAEAAARGLESAAADYLRMLMQALSRPANSGGHVNALLHILGFFKHNMADRTRTALLDAIEDYRQGRVELAQVRSLIRRHLERFPDDYLERQYYLFPES